MITKRKINKFWQIYFYNKTKKKKKKKKKAMMKSLT